MFKKIHGKCNNCLKSTCSKALSSRFLILFFGLFLSVYSVNAQLLRHGNCGSGIESIGWSFDMNIEAQMLPADCAGFPPYQQTNWNSDPVRGQTQPGGVNDLLFNNGTNSGASISWTNIGVNNNWSTASLSQNPTPDEKLNYGYLARDTRMTINDIPFSCYSLLVYYGQDADFGATNLTIRNTENNELAQRLLVSSTKNGNAVFNNVGYIEEDGIGLPIAANVSEFIELRAENIVLSFVWPNTNEYINSNTGPSSLQIINTALGCDNIFSNGFEN